MAVLKIATPLLYGSLFRAYGGGRWSHAPFLVSGSFFVLADLLHVATLREHELVVVPEGEVGATDRPSGRYGPPGT